MMNALSGHVHHRDSRNPIYMGLRSAASHCTGCWLRPVALMLVPDSDLDESGQGHLLRDNVDSRLDGVQRRVRNNRRHAQLDADIEEWVLHEQETATAVTAASHSEYEITLRAQAYGLTDGKHRRSAAHGT